MPDSSPAAPAEPPQPASGAAPTTGRDDTLPLPKQVGRYTVLESLGRGATGSVLLGLDPVLERKVAIKFLRRDLRLTSDERESLLRRMRQEAKASARVAHPHIVTLFDMGEAPDLGVYLVFEHAEGITLKSRLTRGPLSPASAAQLALELGDALTTAHRAGVLHRDVKPDNILLTKTGAKIADFGVARIPESTLTKGGGLLGTPAYSSPESVTHGEHSPASDQFSLASTLYEAISGRRAFPGDDAVGVATRIQTEDPPPIAASLGLDTAVDAVLARALDKQANRRFSSCAELGHALSAALAPGERPSRNPMVTVPDSRHRHPPSMELGGPRRMRVALGGLVLGALTTLLVLRVLDELAETEPTRPAGYTPRSAWLSRAPEAPAPTERLSRRATAAPSHQRSPTSGTPPAPKEASRTETSRPLSTSTTPAGNTPAGAVPAGNGSTSHVPADAAHANAPDPRLDPSTEKAP